MTDFTALQQTLSLIPASTLNSEEKVVWGILKPLWGKNKAISTLHLTNQARHFHQVHLTDRHLRDIIKSLRKKGYPIGSGNQGYWIITDRAELEETTRRLKAHALAELEIVAALEQSTIHKLLGQMQLRAAANVMNEVCNED